MSTTRDVSYPADGTTMVGYLARPDGDGPWPAVLIGHDGIGLHDYQRRRADDLAARGYVALAMDYHGDGRLFFGQPEAMLARVMPLIADADRMRAIGRAALDVLLAVPGVDVERLGAIGYGAGGDIVLALAGSGVPFRAVAVVHPGLPDGSADTADWTDTTGTFLLCTGSDDPICPPDRLLAFGHALTESGIDWRAHIYGGAKHAFWAEPQGRVLRVPPSQAGIRMDEIQGGGGANIGNIGDDDNAEDRHPGPAQTVPGVGYHPKHTPRAWRAALELVDETLVDR